ncbi:MAG: glycosyltransferase family 4 protein [Candidatus Zambryskibacteria bacterium]|nr:glycosyltransferase family 4 protein [Candidatus Zambryskibacteria bacterium]
MAGIFKKIDRWLNGPEITIFHKFQKPPYGGGNQFLLALTKELKSRGYDVGNNTLGKNTKAGLFNSFEFNKEKMKRYRRKYATRMLQRLAGPIGVYRGENIEIDKDLWALNSEYADATVFISEWSYNKYKEIGLIFKEPHVILNASDPDIFHRQGRIAPPDGKRKVKLIATAWSDNPRKGGPLLSWLDKHLDHTKYELTFVGRTKVEFKGAKVIAPVPSEELAEILRQHDIYIAPSLDDPCSNALVEALTCGLPAVFVRSGGHPELVKDAGVGFSNEEEALKAIDTVAANYKEYQNKIENPTLKETVDRYLHVFYP